MLLIAVGVFVVLASVAWGFLLENGQPLVLFQPAEFLIIVGGALGVLVAGNPMRNLKRIFVALHGMRRHCNYTRGFYQSTLKLLYTLFSFARRNGLGPLERQVENPQESRVFDAYPAILRDAEGLSYLCDSIRLAIAVGLEPEELDELMVMDLDVRRTSSHQLVSSLSRVADALPGLGIVAAVLGVVVTMQSIEGPASQIGQKVAAALVGTFLGILLCYGVVGPIAWHLSVRNKAEGEFLNVLRVAVVAFQKGASPIVAAEYARRSIPADLRPSFDEMDYELRRNTKVPENKEAQPVAEKGA